MDISQLVNSFYQKEFLLRKDWDREALYYSIVQKPRKISGIKQFWKRDEKMYLWSISIVNKNTDKTRFIDIMYHLLFKKNSQLITLF